SPHTDALRGTRKRNGRLSVEDAIVVVRHPRHRMRNAGGMNDGIGIRKGSSHVLRPGEITDDGAYRLEWNNAWPAQQYAQPVAAAGQFPQQELPDKAGRSS